MALRFKLDENVPSEAAALLRGAGHDVRTALEQGLGGQPDERILGACQDESRILVTLDLGLADLRAYPPARHAGVWVLRPTLQHIELTLQLLRQALGLAATEPTAHRLWVIEPGRVRIRE